MQLHTYVDWCECTIICVDKFSTLHDCPLLTLHVSCSLYSSKVAVVKTPHESKLFVVLPLWKSRILFSRRNPVQTEQETYRLNKWNKLTAKLRVVCHVRFWVWWVHVLIYSMHKLCSSSRKRYYSRVLYDQDIEFYWIDFIEFVALSE